MTKRKKKISVRLPNKLHAMLTKALDDVERLEKSKLYDVRMSVWARRGSSSNVCEVCLGGSQLIGKLPRGEFALNLFDEDAQLLSKTTLNKLFALNDLRCGSVGSALSSIGKPVDFSLDRDVANYASHPKLWKAQMRLLAVELEQANL